MAATALYRPRSPPLEKAERPIEASLVDDGHAKVMQGDAASGSLGQNVL